jgi:hypothetical protein
MDHTDLYYFARNLVLQLPSVLTMCACVVFAIVRRRRYPQVWLVVVAGLGLLFLSALVFAFVFAFVPDWLVASENFKARQTFVSVLSFIYNGSLAIALAVLLIAVFMRRDPATSPRPGSGAPARVDLG